MSAGITAAAEDLASLSRRELELLIASHRERDAVVERMFDTINDEIAHIRMRAEQAKRGEINVYNLAASVLKHTAAMVKEK